MRALHVPAAGEGPVLGELPVPQAGPGEVLIKVKAVGLNPLDNVLAAGHMAQMLPHEYPLVLGRDVAGVVDAVGDGVEHIAPGQAVLGCIPLAPPVQAGTLAEYALVPAVAVMPLPDGLDFVVAAALPLAASAALAAVEAIGPQPGDVVLVNGATGGVGLFAIQLLASSGATVIATGTADDIERLTSHGVATVVDYTAGSVADQVKTGYPDGVDALINLVGNTNDQVPLDAVRKDGRVAATTMVPDAEAFAAAGLTGTTIRANPVRSMTAPLAELAASGKLTVHVDSVLPLERATEGLATLAAGVARGKVVVTIDD